MDASALVDRTNQYLKSFNDHTFKANELKAAVPLRSTINQLSQSQTQHTENLTRYTQQQDVTSMTGVTTHSDSNLVMDPDDRDRAVEDLKAFKDFVSTLKFAYLENNIKLQFVSHILDAEGPRLVSMEENEALEKERLRTKAELKARKRRAAELEDLIRGEAESLDHKLRKTSDDAQLATQLLRECEQMELELSMLKNKRTPTQRITIEEAQQVCEEQESKLASYGPEIKNCEKKMKETNQRIRAHKSAIEKLAVLKRELTKEMEERDAKGNRDERAEEGCRWITSATALYQSLLGVRKAYTVGTPANELRIEYESPQGQEGDVRTVRILFNGEGKFVGASLLDSSDSIEDLVQAYLPSQDLTLLVLDIRARIGR